MHSKEGRPAIPPEQLLRALRLQARGASFLAVLMFFITGRNRPQASHLLPSRKTTNCTTANPAGDLPAFWSPGSHSWRRASRELSFCSRRLSHRIAVDRRRLAEKGDSG